MGGDGCRLLSCTDDVAGADLLEAARQVCLAAFGSRFSDHDWSHTSGGRRFLVLDGSDVVIGHAAVVERRLLVGDRAVRAGYVEGVAVLPARQGSGIGGELMRSVADFVREGHELGGLSTSRHSFYERLGWERWRGRSYVARGREVVRTPDEDDGLMILRTPSSPDLDLAASITCEERDGDDW